jgi:predicted peroxiredoxin
MFERLIVLFRKNNYKKLQKNYKKITKKLQKTKKDGVNFFVVLFSKKNGETFVSLRG